MNITYSSLSLAARMAVALRCFEDYCDAVDLHHPEITKLFDYLWDFFIVETGSDWKRWEQSRPALIAFGGAHPDNFENLLSSKGMSLDIFSELVGNTMDTVFHIFYAGVSDEDNESSLKCLERVIQITSIKGVRPPRITLFSNALFSYSDWGRRLSVAERDIWRYDMKR